MGIKEKVVVVFMLLFSLIALDCSREKIKDRKERKNPALEIEAISVEAEYPSIRSMAENLEVSGNLEPLALAEVYAKQTGLIKMVYVKEGDRVREGERLAKIEDDEIQLSFRQAKSSYELMKDKYQRYLELFKEKMVSEQEFKEIERSYQDARSNYELYQLRLNNTELTSPIEGTVVERLCEPHQLLSAMEKAFKVAQLDQFKVMVSVTEASLSKLKPGQEVAIRIDALDRETIHYPHQGAIYNISPQIDPNTGTSRLEARIPNPPPGAQPGMFVRLKIITAYKPEVLAISKRSLVREEPAEVWVIKNGQVELRRIETGLADEGFIEVVDGLGKEELVVTAGQEALSDKSRVKVVNFQESQLTGERAKPENSESDFNSGAENK